MRDFPVLLRPCPRSTDLFLVHDLSRALRAIFMPRPQRVIFASALALLMTTLCPSASRAATRRALVLPLGSQGVGADVAEGVRAALQEAIDQDPDWSSLSSTNRLDKMAGACGQDNLRCLSRVGDKRGADQVIDGQLRASESGIQVDLRAINIANKEISAECHEILGPGATGLGLTATRAITQMLSPQRFSGSLMVSANVDGAKLYVDDSRRGTLPLSAPIAGLIEGTHQVRVVKLGYQEISQSVAIVFAEQQRVELRLLRRTDISAEAISEMQAEAEAKELPWRPGLEPWSWGIAGLGGAMLVAGIGTGIAVWSIAGSVEQRATYQVLVLPQDSEAFTQGRSLAIITNILWGLGSVVAATGLTLGLWDQFVPPPATAAKAPKPKLADDEDESWDAEVTRIRDGIPNTNNSRVDPELPPAPDEGPDFDDDGQPDDKLPDDSLPDGDLPEGDL